MFSFRRFVAVMAVISLVSFGALAQSAGSSSSTPAQDQTPPQAPVAAPSTQGPVTVQGRIKARREARRAQAIHDTYGHLYEVFVGGGYQRFRPGHDIQLATMYAWDAAISRNYSEKLGLTFEGRGNYGTAYVGLNLASITRPSISNYDVLVGPTYRFMMRPRYSVAGSAKGGIAIGNFSGDTNGFGPAVLGLYPDGTTYALTINVIGEVNLTPNAALRLAPEYMATGFGSTWGNTIGFTYGLVYRFGKQ